MKESIVLYNFYYIVELVKKKEHVVDRHALVANSALPVTLPSAEEFCSLYGTPYSFVRITLLGYHSSPRKAEQFERAMPLVR